MHKAICAVGTFISSSLTVQQTMIPHVTSEQKPCAAFIGDIAYAPAPNFWV